MDEAARRRVNLVVLVLTLALLAGGVAVLTALGRQQRAQECFEARRTNCVPLDLNAVGR